MDVREGRELDVGRYAKAGSSPRTELRSGRVMPRPNQVLCRAQQHPALTTCGYGKSSISRILGGSRADKLVCCSQQPQEGLCSTAGCGGVKSRAQSKIEDHHHAAVARRRPSDRK